MRFQWSIVLLGVVASMAFTWAHQLAGVPNSFTTDERLIAAISGVLSLIGSRTVLGTRNQDI